MSRVTELEKALTTLFRKGTEVGYAETEIDEFLENIDYGCRVKYSSMRRWQTARRSRSREATRSGRHF